MRQDGNATLETQELESIEERLLELLYERQNSMDHEDPSSFKQLSQRELLPCSPFKNIQLNMPTEFDVGSARGVKFARNSHLQTVIFAPDVSTPIGFVRSNYLILNTLKAFYFEVTILEAGVPPEESGFVTPQDLDGIWNVAVGIYRDGMPMQGTG
eukprot:TRINITY_DN1868_c0_g1_i1.p1 TRINITY_DN1868_c0_g1~~TRINITY_DN1868_c0_g1_i1.p1  ORF type:complete len:166 (+),score=41.96 TRINITY_DN1868_c0_g1_i1:32-499(+)